MPKRSNSASTDTKKDKTDKPSEKKEKSRNSVTVVKDDIPFTKTREANNKASVALQKKHSFEGSTIGVEKPNADKEQKLLDKVNNLEARLRREERERKKTGIQVKKLNKKLSAMQPSKAGVVAATPGAGYLSDGSTIGLGIVDGDDELRVLKKVKRLEARLEEEENKVKSLNKELADIQAAKEKVENDLANSNEMMQEKSNSLLEKIKALESTVKETESRAIAAEQELAPVKKELLKAQISETKTQQELYKLKIEKLKENEE
ncbi:MAG: hypothetical protein H8D23_11160 [Candidatus Brocadiales bacterium]|nr:hypothetical protein [Candidatus Brocadiales bacterium]